MRKEIKTAGILSASHQTLLFTVDSNVPALVEAEESCELIFQLVLIGT